MKEPGLFGDTLPEGVAAELTVGELEEMACRQQQQIESQRQLLAAKEQRLRFLKQHEVKHQLVATEHERLRRLREKVETQEQKLRKLRALRGQVDQTKHDNVSLTSDLESVRALFNEKEKELSIAVAKVEELTRQLEHLQRGRDSNSNQVASSVAAVELEKLRSELLYRNKLNEQHSARLSHQRELLAQRQEEMTAIDGRIGELQDRLHRKRMLNQQLAHHVDNKQRQNRDDNQKFVAQQVYQSSLSQNQSLQKCLQLHQQQQLLQKHQQKLRQMRQMQLQKQNQQHQHQQMQMFTSPSGFNNLSAMCKSVPLKATGNAVAVSQGMCAATKPLAKISGNGANIAAVEPYHHVPSIKSNQQQQQQQPQPPAGAGSTTASDHNKRGSHKNDQPDATPPSGQRIVIYPSHSFAGQRDANTQLADEDDRLAAGTPTEAKPAEGGAGGSRAAEFWSSKFDSKYQTLSTGGVGRYGATSHDDCRRPGEGVESALAVAGVLESNLKFGSIDKRLSSDGYGVLDTADNNRVDDGGNESAVSNEPSQPSDGSSVGADMAAKNLATIGTAGTRGQQQQQQQQQSPAHIHPMNIVRSMPIQTSTNKGVATPLSNASYAVRCTAGSINNFSRSYEASPFGGYNKHSSDNHSVAAVVTCSSTVVTYTSTYQKPVSSVSPIYQTSSTRIQPVQPQIIGSFSTAYNQQIREARNSFLQNDNAVDSYASKPALPPKPAPPVKATAMTPRPPPRQSAFHSQLVGQKEGKSCDQQSTFCDPPADANCNLELESRLAGLDLQEQADPDNEYYSMSATGESDANANVIVGTLINTNARNGLTFHADVSPRKCDSPPPLPNVEPPSDDDNDDVDRPTKLRTTFAQNADDKSNNDNGSVLRVAANDRLVSDRSHDSSSSDMSSAENNYLLVSSNRRIELPPAYLFPESGAPPRHLVAADARQHVDVILSLKSVDQLNADASEDDKTSPGSLSPNSDGSAPLINAYNETKEDTKKLKKGNLKNTNSANSKRRVSFDPLALLLDASLEGELELVVRTAGQVKNPSAANDEGITALHNAICAGHFEIVKFLTQFGCDVNAQDSDGWTPLHCAASCNNLPMVRFLVEHGACIFATTLSDQETAAEKCEEDEEGFDGCSEFLYSVQEKLGILNNGAVYAVFDYEAHNTDELSFKEGDRLTVLRKGDEWEREWWWSRLLDKEGYIPRNLLGLYPRIPGNVNKLQH